MSDLLTRCGNMALCQTGVNTFATALSISQPTNELRRILAEWLANAMRDKGFNQSTLAEASKVSPDTIWRVLHQKTGVNEANLKKLSDTLGQPLPTLSGRSRGMS